MKNEQNTGEFINSSINIPNNIINPENFNDNFSQKICSYSSTIKINLSKNKINNNYENKIFEEELMENEKQMIRI